MASAAPPPDVCANCGASIPRHARACPECGADERTGWRETSDYDGLDLPEDADDTTPRPCPTVARPPGWRHSLNWYWAAIALALLTAAILGVLGLF